VAQTNNFFVYQAEIKEKKPIRILDKKGFIRAQRADGKAVVTKVAAYRNGVAKLWEEMAVYTADAILRPDYYICVGARMMDFSGSGELDQTLMLMEVEMQTLDANDETIIVAAKAQL
jgi:hypothetical protein